MNLLTLFLIREYSPGERVRAVERKVWATDIPRFFNGNTLEAIEAQTTVFLLSEALDINGDGGIEIIPMRIKQEGTYVWAVGSHDFVTIHEEYVFDEVTDYLYSTPQDGINMFVERYITYLPTNKAGLQDPYAHPDNQQDISVPDPDGGEAVTVAVSEYPEGMSGRVAARMMDGNFNRTYDANIRLHSLLVYPDCPGGDLPITYHLMLDGELDIRVHYNPSGVELPEGWTFFMNNALTHPLTGGWCTSYSYNTQYSSRYYIEAVIPAYAGITAGGGFRRTGRRKGGMGRGGGIPQVGILGLFGLPAIIPGIKIWDFLGDEVQDQ